MCRLHPIPAALAALLPALLPLAAGAAEPGPLATYPPQMSPAFVERLRTADPVAGERLFDRKCAQCHDGVKEGRHSKGPHLWNVLGRKAASSPGFDYSPAMRAAGHTWSYATLDYFLADTSRAVPGKAMDLVGIPDDGQRASLIAYLRTLNDAPPPLP